MPMLQFTAERSLNPGPAPPVHRVHGPSPTSLTSSKPDDQSRVLPQLTVTCGSPGLNADCLAHAIPAWWPCELHLWWNQGLAGSCMYWSMVGTAPWCAACAVTAP